MSEPWSGKIERKKNSLGRDDHDTLINLAADMHSMLRLLEKQAEMHQDHESRIRIVEQKEDSAEEVKELKEDVKWLKMVVLLGQGALAALIFILKLLWK